MKALKNVSLYGKITDVTVDGGKIVGTGTPEELCKVKASHTGRYLKPYLKRKGGSR